jgi:hypothetical protein
VGVPANFMSAMAPTVSCPSAPYGKTGMARNKVAHVKVNILNRIGTFYRFRLNAMRQDYRNSDEFMIMRAV